MMKERTLRVLEFTKIRDRLASKAMTDMGRERCEALVPSSNMTEIQRMQAETEEATVILQYVGASPLVPFGSGGADAVRPRGAEGAGYRARQHADFEGTGAAPLDASQRRAGYHQRDYL